MILEATPITTILYFIFLCINFILAIIQIFPIPIDKIIIKGLAYLDILYTILIFCSIIFGWK